MAFSKVMGMAASKCFERNATSIAALGRHELKRQIKSCIDDKINIACFAVFARRKTVSSRADDGVFRKSLSYFHRKNRYFP